jgi:hypothetical protein
MSFVRIPPEEPFFGVSLSALDALEGVDSAQLALAVPYVRIVQVDPNTGAEVGDVSVELRRPPDFGSENFRERAEVSLERVEVKTQQSYGYVYLQDVNMTFVVHRPDLVFSGHGPSRWTELLLEGNSFILEYGWSASTVALKNDLFNGLGLYDKLRGEVVPSRQSILITVVDYTVEGSESGRIGVTVRAKSNGELGLRKASVGDEFRAQLFETGVDRVAQTRQTVTLDTWRGRGLTYDVGLTDKEQDAQLVEIARRKLEDLASSEGFVRDGETYVRLGSILDRFVAPTIEAVCRRIGYSRVDLFLGNFNARAGHTTREFGGEQMSRRSIGDFPVPMSLVRETLGQLYALGKTLRLENVVAHMLELTRGPRAWDGERLVAGRRDIPSIMTVTRNVVEDGRPVFVMSVVDAYDGADPFDGTENPLSLSQQTKENVFRKLRSLSVPVVEVGRTLSYLKSFRFNIQPEGLMRSIFAENQLQDRKKRVSIVELPDPEGRRGRAKPDQIVPLSVLEAEMELLGNFVFDMFSTVWVEFYGAYAISGVYHVRGRTDVLAPGSFTTGISLISEGVDPLNTRRRLSDQEIQAEKARIREQEEKARALSASRRGRSAGR